MNRIAAILYIALIWGCTDAPKGADSSSHEDVAIAQVNKNVAEPAATVPDVKEEVSPSIEEPKPAPEKAPKPVAKTPIKKKIVTKPKPAPSTFANISFDKLVHEFGEIDEGDKITHKFKFKNTGNGPLIIDNVDVSCGCTMPTYPIIPIGPGETGEIGVIYNSKGKFGTQKPSITIKTNATQPLVKLYMSGSIKHVFEKTEIDSTKTKG